MCPRFLFCHFAFKPFVNIWNLFFSWLLEVGWRCATMLLLKASMMQRCWIFPYLTFVAIFLWSNGENVIMILWSLIRVQLGLGYVFNVVHVSQGQICPKAQFRRNMLHVWLRNKLCGWEWKFHISTLWALKIEKNVKTTYLVIIAIGIFLFLSQAMP